MKKYLLLGEDAFLLYSNELISYGFIPICLPRETRLNHVVASHPDTIVFEAYGKLIMNREYFTQLNLPSELAERVKCSDDTPYGDYPNDICFNALTIGGCLVAKQSAISADIKRLGLKAVDVKQGYARCSVLALKTFNAAVTSDKGIADMLEQNDINVLRITPGSIGLKGCDYGFIGGATFVDEEDCSCSLKSQSMSQSTVYFFGSPVLHPDRQKLLSFIESYGYRMVFLPGILTDYGGAIVVRI